MRLPGPHTPTQIAKAFQVTKGAMTHSLGLLVNNGFVSLEKATRDGRSRHVCITSAGVDMFRETVTRLNPYFSDLSASVPNREIEALTKTLQKIRMLMDSARDADA